MHRKVTKAIFPVAGLGTRFLPATKSVPKEIMTLVDKPLVQYAIDEAREAGITDFVFVTSRGKSALEDYFDCSPTLEQTLEERGKTELLERLTATNMESGSIAYLRQHRALGLGHAVWCAHRMLGENEPFAVILPDDVIAGETSCLKQMVEAYEETGGNIVAAMEVPQEQTKNYGVLDVTVDGNRIMKARGMIEKPAPEEAPSNMAVIGRYILNPSVMQALNKGKVGAGGEIQLTDAIAEQLDSEEGVYGFQFEGKRFDCGSKAGYIQATVSFALSNPELSDDLRGYLRALVDAGDI